MTKVLRKALAAAVWIGLCTFSAAQAATNPASDKPAEKLYLQLGQVGLDPARVYQVRGAALDRAAVHISLDDGTIGFTQDVMGRITGAFFVGEGEVLIAPPNEVERRSLSIFTGTAILEEHFATAYFRFNDDVATELRPDLRATDNQQEFLDQCAPTARNLAQIDAMRLMVSFSRMLPVNGNPPSAETPNLLGNLPDRFLHARLQGNKLGVFDVLFDSLASEQIEVGQGRSASNGMPYYDVWTSFSPDTGTRDGKNVNGSAGPGNPSPREDWIAARRYTIRSEVHPPKQIHSDARVQLDVKEGGTRILVFELSRFLQVESVKLDGRAVEFIHNPAMEGTQLSRRGNDVVAVILPEPARAGQKIDLEFVYGGEVLAEAGSGLLYVGARGTWYPNRGLAMADFDLEFSYPDGWTLVATGKPAAPSPENGAKVQGQQTTRWVSERPIPLAGFNLGKYKMASARAGNVTVETYATQGVERDFPTNKLQVIEQEPSSRIPRGPEVIMPSRPSPARNEATVAESAAQAIEYYAQRIGPFPYSRLALTQMPGPDSQGWPGLVFLSSYAFLNAAEREQLHFEGANAVLQRMVPAHEAAHQWWGDLITWNSYRDQWFSEGLANYCALMMLQEKDPASFRQLMEQYRRDLVEKNKDGVSPMEAGPVTLGGRLLSSRFPQGYEAISYGRGTWLFHMLRTMLKDTAAPEPGSKALASGKEEPFVRALHKLRERYEGRSLSTREMMDVFAEDLPPALRYEGKKSLGWFLDGWINGTSLPKLELRGVKFTPKGSGIIVTGTIVQTDAPDTLVSSVPLYAAVPGKPPVLLGRVFADGDESTFRIAAPPGTHKIELDPNQTILTSPK